VHLKYLVSEPRLFEIIVILFRTFSRCQL